LSNEDGVVESAVSRRLTRRGGGREGGNCSPATAAVNLDWLMVKSRIDRNPRYNNQPVMGAATVNKGATVAGAVAGAVAAVATAYVVAEVVATETAMSRRRW
jgi:hypothetical protein